jgi:hypothetical protein
MEAIKKLFGISKDPVGLPGTKFANLLSMGLKAKGFKEEVFFNGEEKGYRYSRKNDIGTEMVFTFGGGKDRYKETPVSALLKVEDSQMFKSIYKTFEFPTIDLRVDPTNLEKVKRMHTDNAAHEERQRNKINKIYDFVGAFIDNDLSKVKKLMEQEDNLSKLLKPKTQDAMEIA